MGRIDFQLIAGNSFNRIITLYDQPNIEIRGEWSKYYSYKLDDVIAVNGSLFRALVANKNVQPVIGATWGSLSTQDLSGVNGAATLRYNEDSINMLVTINTLAGSVEISLTALETVGLCGVYEYDLELTYPDLSVVKPIYGKIEFKKEMTI